MGRKPSRDEVVEAVASCNIYTFEFLFLPSKPHLRVTEIIQGSQKYLISHPLIILHMVDLRKADLPGRITSQLNSRSEENEKLWLGHDRLGKLGVDEVDGDIA